MRIPGIVEGSGDRKWHPMAWKKLLYLFLLDIVAGIVFSLLGMIILTIITFILGFTLPSLIWMSYIYGKDTEEPEPKKAIEKAFLYGIVGALVAIILEVIWGGAVLGVTGIDEDTIKAVTSTTLPALVMYIFSAPVIEEFSKPYFAFRKVRPEVDTRLDGMIYGITAGMGFAFIENLGYEIVYLGNPVAWASLTLVRGLISTAMHAIQSGIVGYALAGAILKSRSLSSGYISPEYGIAVAFHFFFNMSLTFMNMGFLPFLSFLVFLIDIALAFKLFHQILKKAIYEDRLHWVVRPANV